MATNTKLTQRQRKFAELIAGGAPAETAYIEAYPRCRAEATAARESGRLLELPEIVTAIKTAREAKAGGEESKLVMTTMERRKFLARIIRTAPSEVTESDPVCQSYKVTDKTHEVKMPCKLRALELDAKLAGELKEQPAARGEITVVVSSGTLPSLQTGYKELREATHGRN